MKRPPQQESANRLTTDAAGGGETLDTERLRVLVLETLAEIAPEADLDALDPAVSFRDQIDIDSVDFMNLMLSLEKRLGIRIHEADYPKLSSLGGCLDYLAPLIAEKEQAQVG